jgi:hypothetical protein
LAAASAAEAVSAAAPDAAEAAASEAAASAAAEATAAVPEEDEFMKGKGRSPFPFLQIILKPLSLRGAKRRGNPFSFVGISMGTRIATPSCGWFAMTWEYENFCVCKDFRYPHPSASRPPSPQGRYFVLAEIYKFHFCRATACRGRFPIL